MKELRNIIDTWNMLEKFGIDEYTSTDDSVEIKEEDFQRMLNGSKNKRYINNLLKKSGRFCTHGNI